MPLGRCARVRCTLAFPCGAGRPGHRPCEYGLRMNGLGSMPSDELIHDEAATTEPPFGADDPDPFMLPLEAAQIVQDASRGEIDLETATQELVRSLVERRLPIQGQRFGRSRS